MPLTNEQKLRVLTTAREYIATPDTWCQDHIAESPSGKWCDPDVSYAVKFCARGAILRSLKIQGLNAKEWGETEAEVCAVLGRAAGTYATAGGVARWNNTNTHEVVLSGFNKAIESLQRVPA